MNIINWIKNNKLSTLLIIVLGIFVLTRLDRPGLMFPNISGRSNKTYDYDMEGITLSSPSFGSNNSLTQSIAPVPEYNDNYSKTTDRLVTKNSNLSLLVKNVTQISKEILDYTNSIDGFMVSSSLTNPQDSATGNLIIDIPADQLDTTLEYLDSISVKVVSQNLTGRDITAEYQDISSRLEILRSNKARFEQIMDQAQNVDEILRVQTQIFSLQSQIDSLIGQQQYLAEKAKYSRITIYLSTDELSLPYMPDNQWRPQVVLKNAIRSMLSTLQSLGSLIIWLLVYSPILIIFYLIYRLLKRKKI